MAGKERTGLNKTVLYLIYFCIYSAALLLIGKSSLRDNRTVSSYFTCDRKVSLPLCICTFAGTWLSAITILSLTGGVYEDGLAVLFYSVVPWFLGGFLLAGASRRLYRKDVITVPELFGKQYGSFGLQVAFGIIFIIIYIFYLVSQYKGFGMVASALFDIPYPVAVLMVYLFILYTTFGGYRSVVRTDAFNLTLLTLGLLVLFVLIVGKVGGFGTLYQQAAQISGAAHPGVASPTQTGDLLRLFNSRYTPLISLSMFWGWGLGLAANPQYTIRMLCAPDSTTARRTVLGALALLALLYFALVHIGLGMRVLVPHLDGVTSSDEVIIRLLNEELYSGWSGFFLFSIIGACVSTANSQLLLIASSFSYDVVGTLSKQKISQRRILSLGRLAVFGGGTISMLMALDPPNFTLSYGGDVWGAVSVLVFPPMYGALFSRRITRRGVWACIITGSAAILVLYPLYYLGALTIHPALPGMVISTVVMVLVSLLDRKRGAKQ